MINILGAGAIGHLWHCALRVADIDSRLISLHGRQPKTIRYCSNEREYSLRVDYQSLAQVPKQKYWLLCVKSYQLAAVSAAIKPLLRDGDQLVLMMNGANLTPQLAPSAASIYRAVLVHGAKFVGENLIHSGGGITWIGSENSGLACSSALRQLLPLLNRALPEVQWHPNLEPLVWQKLVINAVINPLTALCGQPNKVVLDGESLAPSAKELFEEIYPIARPQLGKMDKSSLEAQLIDVARKTGENVSSMLQDRNNKRPLEIDAILLPLIEEAEKQRLPHQRLLALYQQLSGQH